MYYVWSAASTTKDCLKKCNGYAHCKFWDYDTTNNICRLRSTKGAGQVASASYYGGPKNCIWGIVVNHLLIECIAFSTSNLCFIMNKVFLTEDHF